MAELAYERLAPPSIERIELMIARGMALFANVNRGKGVKAFLAKDFMPDYLADDAADSVQTPEQQAAALTYITGMTGGQVFDEEATDEEMEAYVLHGVDISEYGNPEDGEEMQRYADDQEY